MRAEADNYCIGLLKDIYQFEKRSKSEYRDWAADAPGEYFEIILDDWKERFKNAEAVKQIDEFIKKHFPCW